MLAKLERRAYLPHCVLGTLMYRGKTLVTIEKPHALAEGRYYCERVAGDGVWTWQVITDAPGPKVSFVASSDVRANPAGIGLGLLLSEQEYAVLECEKAFMEFTADTAKVDSLELVVVPFQPR